MNVGFYCAVAAPPVQAYSPDEARDDKGKWTSGDVFVSPNVDENLNMDEAMTALAGDRQKRFEAKEQDIVSQILGEGKVIPTLGVWADGAENSTRIEVPGGAPDKIRYVAALTGKAAGQKAVLVWQRASNGPHVLYSFSSSKSPQEIAADVQKAGIENETIEPGKTSTVLVLDQDGSLAGKVGKLSSQLGYSELTHEFGRGDFIGSMTSREEGAAAYDKIIQSYEKAHTAYKGNLEFRGTQRRTGGADFRGWPARKTQEIDAVSPPGWKGTTQEMLKHPEITNPYALTWYQYEKGDKAHHKPPKGTPPVHVSERVKKKRATALKRKKHTHAAADANICECGHSINKHKPPDFACGWCADCKGFVPKGIDAGQGPGWWADSPNPHISHAVLTPSKKEGVLRGMGFKLIHQTDEHEVWQHELHKLQLHVSKYNSPNQPNLRKFAVVTPEKQLASTHQFGKVLDVLKGQMGPDQVTLPGIVRPKPVQEESPTEQALKTVKIVSMSPIGNGVNRAELVELGNGEKGVYKANANEYCAHGITCGHMSAREVGAYQVAKIVGLGDMVPATVKRDKGSLQQFINGKMQVASSLPSGTAFPADETLGRAAAFDYVIGNMDRHNGNWLSDGNGNIKLIDHGLAFGSNDPKVAHSASLIDQAFAKGLTLRDPAYAEHRGQIISVLRNLGLPGNEIAHVSDRIDRIAAGVSKYD